MERNNRNNPVQNSREDKFSSKASNESKIGVKQFPISALGSKSNQMGEDDYVH